MSEGGGYAREKGGSVERDGTMCMSPCVHYERLKQDEGRCGLGGKVNTNPGKQNARFRGSKICANRAIRGGEEIFVPYRGNFKLEREIVDDERDGWGVFGRRFFRDMG